MTGTIRPVEAIRQIWCLKDGQIAKYDVDARTKACWTEAPAVMAPYVYVALHCVNLSSNAVPAL